MVKIKVTSPSFSKNKLLAKKLRTYFPESELNVEGIHFNEEHLIEYLSNADGAIIGLEQINENVLKNCPKLAFISKYGVGLDNIDQAACCNHNVKLGWTGGVNRRSAAELTLGLMIGLFRNIFATYVQLRDGEWRKEGGFQLSGKTVGIIGVGNVGKEVARLLEPFHCKILGNDILDLKNYYRENGLIEATKEEIYEHADIIALHVPLTDQTHHLINSSTLHKMRPEAMLINVSRGEVVNQEDLKIALQEKIIAAAALDVYESEPPTDMDFLRLPNLVCTPHIGGNAEEGILAMGQSAIWHLNQFYEQS